MAGVVHSCADTPINGELDAQWQVLRIQYVDGDEVVPTSPNRYISFYRYTIQFAPGSIFNHTGNMVYDESASTISVEIPAWTSDFNEWGLDVPENPYERPYVTSFNVEHLSAKNLTLVTPEGTVITLRKY